MQKVELKSLYFNLVYVFLFSSKTGIYVTLHRILMLKVKARARHAFTLKQKNLF